MNFMVNILFSRCPFEEFEARKADMRRKRENDRRPERYTEPLFDGWFQVIFADKAWFVS